MCLCGFGESVSQGAERGDVVLYEEVGVDIYSVQS